jgi:hypothetical protein
MFNDNLNSSSNILSINNRKNNSSKLNMYPFFKIANYKSRIKECIIKTINIIIKYKNIKHYGTIKS